MTMFWICGALILLTILSAGNISDAGAKTTAALALVGAWAYIMGWAVRHLSDPRMKKITRKGI